MWVSRLSFPVLALVSATALACSSATPAPEAPPDELPAMSEQSSLAPVPEAPSEPAEEETAPAPAEPSGPEPQFPENASVDQAIKAVPQGVERRNIDPETLAKPLQDPALYESCKPGTARVKMRIAVWDGKAVGIDLTTTPKNDRLADCIKGKLRELTWEKKVKSLNTIEYQL